MCDSLIYVCVTHPIIDMQVRDTLYRISARGQGGDIRVWRLRRRLILGCCMCLLSGTSASFLAAASASFLAAASASCLLHFFPKNLRRQFYSQDIQRIEQRADFFDIVAALRTPKSAGHSNGCTTDTRDETECQWLYATECGWLYETRDETEGHDLCVAAVMKQRDITCV